MTTVVISPSNVVTFPEGGGHFWVYMQYIKGFQALGCEIYWLERFNPSGDKNRDKHALKTFYERVDQFGLAGKSILYSSERSAEDSSLTITYIGDQLSRPEEIFGRADLLLNFYYAIPPEMLAHFKRTALVDIDPGLLQFWISNEQIFVHPHDLYFTTGETVGTPNAKFPDCLLPWIRIRPPVSLELWPYAYDPESKFYTTVSSWWGGGGKGEFITDGKELLFENNKRVTFLDYIELPKLTNQAIELALNLGEAQSEVEKAGEGTDQPANGVTDYISDEEDRKTLERFGWNIKHAYDVAGNPETYQAYIQGSRGEFSCAKPSCMYFQNAWISDRTLCYLASGKPAIVQYTGPSAYLPSGEGLFRFSSIGEAVEAFAAVASNYQKHCIAAREIAETHFDSKEIMASILNQLN
ncbi:MAG: hypothetical protein JSV42_05795 [Chloroflexota bacterium]|nr:MAG: hypothetical protein JSV42_05795 [Chloroflexota bacterium]